MNGLATPLDSKLPMLLLRRICDSARSTPAGQILLCWPSKAFHFVAAHLLLAAFQVNGPNPRNSVRNPSKTRSDNAHLNVSHAADSDPHLVDKPFAVVIGL